MFEARLGSAETLKKVLEAIKEISNEGLFDCSDGGIQVVALDDAHVSVVSMALYSEGFEYYRCERDFIMKINLERLATIFKFANSDDTVTIKTQVGEDTVTFIFEPKEQGRVSGFKLNLMDPDEQLLVISETAFSCVIRLPSCQFRGICRDLSQFGESVVISFTKDKVRFSSSGDRHYFVNNEDESSTSEIEEPCDLAFDCQYLNLFTKATSLSRHVQLGIDPNIPLMVEYQLPNLGYVRYYLVSEFKEFSLI